MNTRTKNPAIASAVAGFFISGLEKTDGEAGSKRPVDGCSGRGRVDSGSCRSKSRISRQDKNAILKMFRSYFLFTTIA